MDAHAPPPPRLDPPLLAPLSLSRAPVKKNRDGGADGGGCEEEEEVKDAAPEHRF